MNKGDIIAKFAYVTKRHARNLLMEVTADTRRQIIQKKVKLGWIMCNLGDYWSLAGATNVPNLITDPENAEE